MQYVKLGWSGVKVSQLCLGTWYLPRLNERDEYGIHKVDVNTTIKIMRRAYDEGINCIDTANRYHGAMAPVDLNHVGNSEKVVGEFLKTVDRESIVLATKVRGQMAPWPNGEGLSRKHIRWQIKESLRRLGTSYVDLYQIHWPDPDTPKIETLRTLNHLVEDGLVNYIGESNHPAHDIVEFMELADKHNLEPFTTMQEVYNVLSRDIERDKIPVAKRYGMAILAYSPLAQGVLTGKYVDFNTKKWTTPSDSRAAISSGLQGYFNDRNLKILLELNEIAKSKGATLSQVSLAWLISMQERFGVNIIPIIGVSRMEHLEDNLGALNVKLSQDDLKRIDEVLKTQ
ncbi:aldo/keto reductase [Caldivirga sp.]|uniref:aldo/keto reductase n=1 Tax=Caldivirga sp. TaxID=2080243 RepID=UPI003D0E1FE9